MTFEQELLTIGVVMIGTMLTRFAPFFLFPETKTTPTIIQKIGRLLPSAVMGMLVIYGYKDLDVMFATRDLWPLVAGMVVVIVHLKWRNVLASIATGTVFYLVITFLFSLNN